MNSYKFSKNDSELEQEYGSKISKPLRKVSSRVGAGMSSGKDLE